MEEKVSAHASIREMYERVHEEGLSNLVDRFEVQEPTRCPFCTPGLSYQLCSNGPCRITKRADRGVCGIRCQWNGHALYAPQKHLTGGKLVLEPDPMKAVDGIEKHI